MQNARYFANASRNDFSEIFVYVQCFAHFNARLRTCMCFRDVTCSALQADANAFHPMTKFRSHCNSAMYGELLDKITLHVHKL